MVVGVCLPAEVLNYHRVGTLVAETGRCLPEKQISIITVVVEQVTFQLDIHFLKSNVHCLDFLEQRLIFDHPQLFGA